jgi:hypothetical protein
MNLHCEVRDVGIYSNDPCQYFFIAKDGDLYLYRKKEAKFIHPNVLNIITWWFIPDFCMFVDTSYRVWCYQDNKTRKLFDLTQVKSHGINATQCVYFLHENRTVTVVGPNQNHRFHSSSFLTIWDRESDFLRLDTQQDVIDKFLKIANFNLPCDIHLVKTIVSTDYTTFLLCTNGLLWVLGNLCDYEHLFSKSSVPFEKYCYSFVYWIAFLLSNPLKLTSYPPLFKPVKVPLTSDRLPET